jgi:hypothetical protein
MRRFSGAALALCCALTPGAAKEPEPAIAEGTLLFLENCNSVVEWSTRGQIAHVALVFHEAGEAWVYEAMPGKVRRVALAEYQVELARLNNRRAADDQVRLLALAPQPSYTRDEIASMRKYIDEQLGRRYSVKNYVRGKPYDGVHCAELAAGTLNQSGRYAFAECHKTSPQALHGAVLRTHFDPQVVAIPPLAEQEEWTVRARRGWSGWFSWCGWSCREAWLFLW